jgi:hypothetical protein
VIAASEVLLDPFLHPRERRITRRQSARSDEQILKPASRLARRVSVQRVV